MTGRSPRRHPVVAAGRRPVAAAALAAGLLAFGVAVTGAGPRITDHPATPATTGSPELVHQVNESPAGRPAPAVSPAATGSRKLVHQVNEFSPARPGRAADPTTTDPGPNAPGPAPGLRQEQECVPTPGRDGTAAASAAGGRGDPLAAVHRLADGSGQRIAVIDTGVSPSPRLSGRLIGGGDYLAGGDGLDDCDGHGTEVAGLLAATPDPTTRSGGGVAPAAQVLSLRQSSARYTVTGPDGRDRPAGEIDTLAAAITRAVALGATVVNISEVVCVPADQADAAGRPLERAVRRATDAGVVVVAAAGNVDTTGTCTGGSDLRPLPAADDGVIAVGAVDGADRPADFSLPGDWVDVAAPGVDVRPSALTTDGSLLSGTSYASPVVAGVAALLRERFPSLTPDQVADRIRATARHPARGRDDRVGYGVLDPTAALTAEPLLLHPDDPAGNAAAVPVPDARDDVARLPGLGQRPADRTPAVIGGTLAVLALGGLVVAVVRRLSSPAARPRPSRPVPGPVPRPGAAGATPPREPARRR